MSENIWPMGFPSGFLLCFGWGFVQYGNHFLSPFAPTRTDFIVILANRDTKSLLIKLSD